MPFDNATAGLAPVDKPRTAVWPPIPERVQVAIVFLPVLFAVIFIFFFGVDLPFADEWAVVPAVMHMESGHLLWSDIYRQHNEAVMPVSMAVTLLLAKATHYDVLAEAYASFACLAVSLAVLFAFFRRVQRTLPIPTLAFLPIAAILLGWRNHDGILWGAGLYINLGLMLLLLLVWAAIRTADSPWFFGLAILMAVLATFSFGSGLLAWPVGLAILFFPADGRRSLLRMLLWTTVAVAITLVYFNGYIIHRVPWPTGLGFVLGHPVQAAEYALVYTGSALGASPRVDACINIVLILLFLPAAWIVVRNAELRKALLPFAAMHAFLVLTIPPLLLGRLGLGVDQPYYASRYAPMAAMGPVGIYVFLLALACRPDAAPLASSMTAWRNVLAIALVVIGVGVMGGYEEGLVYAWLDHPKKAACREVLKDYRILDDGHLTCFYPDYEVGRRLAFWLDEYHLSVFRERPGTPMAGK